VNFASLAIVAWQALHRNAMRSFLTMLGVIIGVAAVITSMAIGAGARAAVQQQLARIGSNLIIVESGSVTTGGVRLGAGQQQSLKAADADAIAQVIPEVSAVAPQSQTSGQAVAGNQNWYTSVIGSTPAWTTTSNWTMAQGRFFDQSDLNQTAKVAVLGQTVANNLFPNGHALGSIVIVKNVPFTVIGVLQSKGQSGFGRDQDDQIVVPLTSFQLRLTGNNWVSEIMISANSPDAVASIITSTQRLLRLRHRLASSQADDFQVRNISNIQQAATATAGIQSLLLAIVATVSLVVGGIGIMNIMLVSVTERTREIGIRMAVGAKQRDIMWQFLVEAVTLACAGGIIGILTGLAVSGLTSHFAGWSLLIPPMAIVLAFGFSALIGISFGFYPARRAALLNPIEALRHE